MNGGEDRKSGLEGKNGSIRQWQRQINWKPRSEYSRSMDNMQGWSLQMIGIEVFYKIEKKKDATKLFYRVSITPIPKQDKDIKKYYEHRS